MKAAWLIQNAEQKQLGVVRVEGQPKRLNGANRILAAYRFRAHPARTDRFKTGGTTIPLRWKPLVSAGWFPSCATPRYGANQFPERQVDGTKKEIGVPERDVILSSSPSKI
jgi:hypothetical protein